MNKTSAHPTSGTMEHRKENTGEIAGKVNVAPEEIKGGGAASGSKGAATAGGQRAARNVADLDEPDDDLPEPAHPVRNKLREYRIENMMSKAELARKAGLSVLTVARIEKGYDCRMDTKRKLLKALGLKLADRRKVFEDE